MNTIKIILASLLLLTGSQLYAQSNELALAREDMRANKTLLMGQAMSLNETQAELFWPIYRAYQAEADGIYDARFKLIREYGDNYERMSEDKAAELGKEFFKLHMNRWKLREKYYKRVTKALNPILAVRFAQADQQLATLIDVQLMTMVPLIAAPEELELPSAPPPPQVR